MTKKRDKNEVSKGVARTIRTTTHGHGRWGSWGETVAEKEPGTFSEEALEPELEIPEIVQEMALEEETPVEAKTEPIVEDPVKEEEDEPDPIEAEPQGKPTLAEIAEMEKKEQAEKKAKVKALRAKLKDLGEE